jgi:hypothetical protein
VYKYGDMCPCDTYVCICMCVCMCVYVCMYLCVHVYNIAMVVVVTMDMLKVSEMRVCSTPTRCGGESSLRVELFGDVEYTC